MQQSLTSYFAQLDRMGASRCVDLLVLVADPAAVVLGLARDVVAARRRLAHVPPRARLWLVSPELVGSSLVRLLVRLRRQGDACFFHPRRLDYDSRSFHHHPPHADYDVSPDHLVAEPYHDAQDVHDQARYHDDSQGLDHDAQDFVDSQSFDVDAQSFDIDAQGFHYEEAVDEDLGSRYHDAQALDQDDHHHRHAHRRHRHRDPQPSRASHADQPSRQELGVRRLRPRWLGGRLAG